MIPALSRVLSPRNRSTDDTLTREPLDRENKRDLLLFEQENEAITHDLTRRYEDTKPRNAVLLWRNRQPIERAELTVVHLPSPRAGVHSSHIPEMDLRRRDWIPDSRCATSGTPPGGVTACSAIGRAT